MFDTLEADIVVMQETKIQRKDLRDDMVLVPGWDVYFSLPKYKKGLQQDECTLCNLRWLTHRVGYSGVAIYTRSTKCCPIRAEEGITGVLCPPKSSTSFRDLPPDQHIGGYPSPGQLSDSVDEQTLDSEGRCVILEFPAFVLIGVYSPATRDESRTEFREAYIDAIDARVRNLVDMGKQVFLCGDLNIVRSELDTAGLAERLRKEAMTLDDFKSIPSRRFLNHLVFGGDVVGERDRGREKPVLWDLCREFHPSRAGMYTCWETRKNARPGNFGSRIDYVLCSSGIKDWFIDSNIQEGLLGSDHCPVYATIGDDVNLEGRRVPLVDLMNPPDMFKGGKRLRNWSPKDFLSTSAKLIPEFDRRQSIRDMFVNKNNPIVRTDAQAQRDGDEKCGPADIAIEANHDTTQKEIPPPASQRSGTSALVTSNNTASQSSPSRQGFLSGKRIAESSAPPNRPQKKGKTALSRESSTNSPSAFSQSTLKGFFKPKTPTPDVTCANKVANLSDSNCIPMPDSSSAADHTRTPRRDESSSVPGVGGDSKFTIEESPKPESAFTEKVFDPIQAKESWSKLLGKRVVPRCEHGEDCLMLVTKKSGINCGMLSSICDVSVPRGAYSPARNLFPFLLLIDPVLAP